MKRYVLSALLLLTTPAVADSSFQVASALGSAIASEQPCGLTYDQTAIEAFIEKRVKADDLSFVRSLEMMVGNVERDISKMSQSALTAHCAQIRRAAKAYKFIP